MVYLDRGVIASNGVNGSPATDTDAGTGIQGEFSLSKFQDGLLVAAFMVGLLVASPLFSEAIKHHNAFRLLGAGMGIWTLAVLGCSLSWSFSTLLLCRMFVGVGEASFVALAAPFIDDFAPPAAKARWFAFFYLCIPGGYALGYIFGGVVGVTWGWRWVFGIEAASMVPFVAFTFLSAPLHLHGSEIPEDVSTRSTWTVLCVFARDVGEVGRHRVWACMCIAQTLYTAVLGVYAFWGPQAGHAIFWGSADVAHRETADMVFGGVTVLTGIAGVLAGGMLLDMLGSSLRNANLVCAGSTAVGAVIMLLTFPLAHSFGAFMAAFALGELVLFMMSAPTAAIGMWAVPTGLRPLAISLNTCAIHLLGDVPSPPLLGALQTSLTKDLTDAEARDQQWRVSMSVITVLLLPAAGVFFLGALLSPSSPDYRDKPLADGATGVSADGIAEDAAALAAATSSGTRDRTPLLQADNGSDSSSALLATGSTAMGDEEYGVGHKGEGILEDGGDGALAGHQGVGKGAASWGSRGKKEYERL